MRPKTREKNKGGHVIQKVPENDCSLIELDIDRKNSFYSRFFVDKLKGRMSVVTRPSTPNFRTLRRSSINVTALTFTARQCRFGYAPLSRCSCCTRASLPSLMLRVRERVKRRPKAPPNSFWYAAFSKREKIRQVFIKRYDQDIFQQLL